MKNIIKSTVAVAVFALSTTSMFAAGSSTSPITVSANVAANCLISTTTNLAFGAYDPVVTNASTPKDETAPAVISIACTKGTASTVTLATTTPLSNGTDTLSFSLFRDSGHATAFGSLVTNHAAKTAIPVSIWGQIGAGQDVSTGAYAGVVTATINY
jgi:spore coat protein U-like protein